MKDSARNRLILALDVGRDVSEALGWIDRLKNHVGMFKVGKEAFTTFGPDIVRRIEGKGGRVFLDLKFHDIPNTVARAAEAATRLGVSMFNVHALGGRKMMGEAVRSAEETSRRLGSTAPMVLGVTVLTSLDDDDMGDLGFQESSASRAAVRLARLAKDAGLSGVVASARDITIIRENCGEGFVIVTPGIRLGDHLAGDDQKRVLTPQEAVRRGADFLVVGRPIMTAPDPVASADEIVEAIAAGLAVRQRKS